MDYRRIYNNIINYRKQKHPNGYYENHHIVPRSLGGSDDKNNIVKLTAREHFICHYLLAKMYEKGSNEWYKTNHAFMMMKSSSVVQARYFNSRLYESLRDNMCEVMSHLQTGEKNSQFGTQWIHNKTLRKNKKISKMLELPIGWELGRVIKWDKKIVCCKHCSKEFDQKRKEMFCSDTCKKEYTNPFVGKEKEFLTLYKKYNSMNKALKEMGFPGAVSHYYKWAKKLIDDM